MDVTVSHSNRKWKHDRLGCAHARVVFSAHSSHRHILANYVACLQDALWSRTSALSHIVKWDFISEVVSVLTPNQMGSLCFRKRQGCALKECSLWVLGRVFSQQQTHRRGRLPSFCSADKSEILGLVSTKWGGSVLCHHWDVVWRCCGGQQKH